MCMDAAPPTYGIYFNAYYPLGDGKVFRLREKSGRGGGGGVLQCLNIPPPNQWGVPRLIILCGMLSLLEWRSGGETEDWQQKEKPVQS